VIVIVLKPYCCMDASTPPFSGLDHIAPHDLRSCAKLCHDRGGELEQIQFLLGHASVQTTERYLGCLSCDSARRGEWNREGQGFVEIAQLLAMSEDVFDNRQDVLRSLNRLVAKQLGLTGRRGEACFGQSGDANSVGTSQSS
jgi:hypothetical protein